MERRVLLAIFLCFIVMYVWQAVFVKPAPKRPTSAASAPSGSVAAPPAGESSAPVAAPAAVEPSAPSAAPLVADQQEQEVRVETDDVVAVFTNRGGRLKSWRLKQYHDRNNQPLELIATDLPTPQPLPFSLRTADDAANGRINAALYQVQQPSSNAITFEYRDSSGLHATKQFTVGPTPYTVTVRATVAVNDRPLDAAVVWGPGLGDTDSQTGRYAVKPGGILSTGGKVKRLSAGDIAKQSEYDQSFDYAGIDDHYFMSVAMKPGAAKASYQPLSIPPPPNTKDPTRDFVSYSLAPARAGDPLTFYVGPKDFGTLKAIGPEYVKAINFGTFDLLVVPLLRSLNWIHQYVGNYGWAIIVLTVLINVVLFPLNHKSVVSMRKMQEIQPQAKAIQDRYAKLKATDPAKQKMNQELMALYRERGVNPASGCIPLLLMMPVFLAFYAMLQTAIELRGAPFLAWIHDLSAPDPYYVLPVLVGVSQVVQQLMTPQTGVDPAQQKMMLVMPLVLIFVFIASPAGALLYWLASTVIRIGQMQLTNYMIGPPTVHTPRPAAERRLKRVGGGRTDAAAKES
jgi:YidC/Oxa1 family membrane protein insertase